MYFLDQAAVGEASLTISDADGNEIETFSEHDPRGEEGSPRAVVHHRRRGHEHLPMADDVSQTA